MRNLLFAIGIVLAIVGTTYSCDCPTAKPGDEVCGSNGITYESDCSLSCALWSMKADNQKGESHCLTKVYNGTCTKNTCKCSTKCHAVCDNTGYTHANKCAFRCAKRHNKQLKKVACQGKCF